ncbi:hypothetical protein CFC21_037360 [Triticum aestivum]|uniref:RING-type domain-containing protein n=1 Tax=Triticum aestivum TaxID=4565 RepID=A0A9R1FA65_WHEAT|nr:uncharacterized protein LOC123058940 [Triticum aestivum]KAF7025131.1 hypothetical protein CFC21_037360 [Triticum aestivum]
MAAAASASPSGSGRSNLPATAGACPICLEAIEDEAYLDACLHSFCYRCITQWVKIVASKREAPLSSARCPLCKTDSASIVHAFDGESFQQHHIEHEQHRPGNLSDAHALISQIYNTREVSGDKPSMQKYWKQRKYLRRNVWLEPWLRREIQALTRDEDVDAIVYHILGIIDSATRTAEKPHASKETSPEKAREEFVRSLSDAARPFLHGRTARFIAEVELFLVSQLNIDAYGRARAWRFRESASHVTREQGALPRGRPLEDHYFYLYFLSDQADYVGGEM